jgi:hypothetical protein
VSSNAIQASRAPGSAARRVFPVAGLLVFAALATAGCEATVFPAGSVAFGSPDSDVFVRASVVPRDIWAYPHVLYGESYAYLVDGRWYYPTPDGWMVFRREPIELSRQRTQIGEQRYRTPIYPSYPPEQRNPGYPQEQRYPAYPRERTPYPR